MTLDRERELLMFTAAIISKMGEEDITAAQATATIMNAHAIASGIISKQPIPDSLQMPGAKAILEATPVHPPVMLVLLQLAQQTINAWAQIQQGIPKGDA